MWDIMKRNFLPNLALLISIVSNIAIKQNKFIVYKLTHMIDNNKIS